MESPASYSRLESTPSSFKYDTTASYNKNNNTSCSTNNNSSIKTLTITISGMTCAMCAKVITNALHDIPGITNVKISIATDTAVIDYDETELTNAVGTVTECVEDMGYGLYDYEEMRTIATTRSESTGLMIDGWDEDDENDESSSNNNNSHNSITKRQSRDANKMKKSFLFSLLGTIPILLITMIFHHIPPLETVLEANLLIPGLTVESLLLFVLATPIQFISGGTFYRGAYESLRHAAWGMDVLIALGTSVSYVYAVAILMENMIRGTAERSPAHFFETSAVLVSFVLLGKWMQMLATSRTSLALTKLMNLQSRTAVLVMVEDDRGGEEEFSPEDVPFREMVVSIDVVQHGDILKVIRGASIPADGTICYGEMSVDESMITGEPLPSLKTRGERVIGGTICVEGVAFVTVTGVGSETALSQIVRLVEDAQMSQAPIQEFADRVAGVLVPVVCGLSMVTLMIWLVLCFAGVVPESWYDNQTKLEFSITFAIATLVISCPCSLGLATPTALMVGTGVGASNGILIKGGEQLQKASAVNVIIFDKTGTLTKGRPCVTYFQPLPSYTDDINALLWKLASLERNSEHPLATAIVSYSETTIPPDILREKPLGHPDSFTAITGRGVFGSVEGTPIAIGNHQFMTTQQIPISSSTRSALAASEDAGRTTLLVAIDHVIVAIIGIADEIQPDAAATIRHLRNQRGIATWMVTGDNDRTARSVAETVGIPPTQIVSEALPAEKVQAITHLQQEGHVVAMVGDGINDAPALATADVGISIGAGAAIAAEAADMVLVRGVVGDVVTAMDLTRVIFRRIRLNFIWALLYNCLAIPIAAGVFYPVWRASLPPAVAGAAMSLSSLSVVMSSLALKLYKPPVIQ